MTNGSNAWNVVWSRIIWLHGAISQHGNVLSVDRRDDILFEVKLNDGRMLSILCLDEYVMGITAVYRARREFPEADIIFVGGAWNGYTAEAKRYCLQAKLGLFNSFEFHGALWRDDFWQYHKKDSEGNPDYPCGPI